MGPNKNVYEIVVRFLDNSEFDGLFNESNCCSCLTDDLAPCGEIAGECEAGYCATQTEAVALGVDEAETNSGFYVVRVKP